MEIIQKNNAEDGLFIALDGETKMGYIQYEWFEPNPQTGIRCCE